MVGHRTRTKKALIGRRPAHDKTPRVQGGDRANRTDCQVFFAHFVIIFFVSNFCFAIAFMAAILMLNV
jgi:hypothetical protein